MSHDLLDLNLETVDLGITSLVELGAALPVDLVSLPPVPLGNEAVEPEPDALLPDGRLRVEADAEAELNAVAAKFQAVYKQNREDFTNATDSCYFVSVCFQSRAQLTEFLNKANLMDKLDSNSQFLDGKFLAERMGIKLNTPALRLRRPRQDRRTAELAD